LGKSDIHKRQGSARPRKSNEETCRLGSGLLALQSAEKGRIEAHAKKGGMKIENGRTSDSKAWFCDGGVV
jgi:hypothetical protein